MKKIGILVIMLGCLVGVGFAQDNVKKDGLVVYTTSWDDFTVDSGYLVYQWSYNKSDTLWYLEKQLFYAPEILGDESYAGNVYDMGMDMITLKGRSDLSGIFTVSKGDSHFPSQGTEFQHRRLMGDGVWESVQAPLFTTASDISPLGVDIYYDGSTLHIAWIEDNDEAGPSSMMCEIYDQVFTADANGLLTAQGEKKLVFSKRLNWGGTYPGTGGFSGLTVCDFDSDGDMDFIVGDMFYGDSPAKVAIQLIERLASDQWATAVKDLWNGSPGHGAEGVCYADIDGDDAVDILITSANSYAWNVVAWLEKEGDVLIERDALIDTPLEAELSSGEALSVGHIFGLYCKGKEQSTGLVDWSLF